MAELNDILQDLESSLGPLSGVPIALDGGITNRNYRVSLGGSDYVVRRPGHNTELLGIDRHAERLASDAAAGLGIAPAVIAEVHGCLVTDYVSCRPLAPDEVAGAIAEVAALLRAFHESGIQLPSSFWVAQLLGDYQAIVASHGGSLPSAYRAAVQSVVRIDAALSRPLPRPSHNDLLPGNILRGRTDGRIMLVDWEYAGMGDPRFDLGNLSVNNGFGDEEDERLLGAYYGTVPDDRQRAALKLMRIVSDAREAAWGVVQTALSELEFDFDGYAREHFERLGAAVALPDFEEWLAAAAGA